MKNDKQINRGAFPPPNDPSGFQPPHKPGYDVIETRGPGAIHEVGDMADVVYPSGLNAANVGADLSPEATNRLGGFGGRTESDPHHASEFEHPNLAEKVNGSPATTDVPSIPIRGAGSDAMGDCYPDRQRSNAAPDADDY